MTHDKNDGLPVVGTISSVLLGARPGVDLPVDEFGNVSAGNKGMSVSPAWRDLPASRIPKRLRSLSPGATGSNSSSCYTMGEGQFENAAVDTHLELIVDSLIHGVVTPAATVAEVEYQANLAATRAQWTIDEA